MKRIGLISDTHGSLAAGVEEFLRDCDEIWHAGDIGTAELGRKLEGLALLRAVTGNIDGAELRRMYPPELRFQVEGLDVWMVHIAGYPGRYERAVQWKLEADPPKLLVAGHSHILKVMPDPRYGLLFVNPGAAGHYGWHKHYTAIRFVIDQGQPREMEVLEKIRRGRSLTGEGFMES